MILIDVAAFAALINNTHTHTRQVNAVRYMIFTVSNRAQQVIARFAQMHANKSTV
jgi:hypothetical protein